MRKKLPFLTLVIFIAVAGCSGPEPKGAEIHDVIPFLSVYAEDSLTVRLSDLFYASDYGKIRFESSETLSASADSAGEYLKIITGAPGVTVGGIPFTMEGAKYEIPLKIDGKITVDFAFRPPVSGETISVFGSFNSWNRYEYLLSDTDSNGIWTTQISFDPGRYEYKFFIDGREYLDPNNPDSLPNGLGGFNSILTVDSRFPGREPVLYPLTMNKRENGRTDLHFRVIRGDFRQPLNKTHFYALYDNCRIPDKDIMLIDDEMVVSLNPKEFPENGLHRIRCVLGNHLVRSNVAEVLLRDGEPLPLKNEQAVWNDAVMYALMIDRFYNGDETNDDPVDHPSLAPRANFNGGDLAGVKEKMEEGYFNRLGVNTLWLLPFFETSDKAFRETPEPHRWFTGYHGYWPVSARNVEPRFGTNEQLKAMVDYAHENDIKILMDFISNHVHEEHPYFINHRDWFGMLELPDGRQNLRLWDEQRLTTWFDPYIPSFDYLGAPEAMEQVTEDAMWWLENYGFDGFRHDAVKHVPNEFWRELTRKIKTAQPDHEIYQIGETFGDYALVNSYVNNGQLSAQFNFNLYWPARYSFAVDSSDFRNLDRDMHKSLDIYGQLNVMGNVMDSHDQPRYAGFLDGDLDWGEDAAEAGWNRDFRIDHPETYEKINLYMTYLMTIPGIPVLYYGDEIGMTGAADPDNRRMMRWGKQVSEREKKLRIEISRLIDIRNSHSALRYGVFHTLQADESVYAYLRADFNETVLVVNYRGAGEKSVDIRLPEELGFRRVQTLYGAVGAELENGILTLEAEPYSGHIFILK